MAIGIAVGFLTAAVPFVLSKLATSNNAPSSGGWFRTHTRSQPAPQAPSSAPLIDPWASQPAPQAPPSSLPLIDPWASQPAPQAPPSSAQLPAPQPMPEPPILPWSVQPPTDVPNAPMTPAVPYVMPAELAQTYQEINARNAATNAEPMQGSSFMPPVLPAPPAPPEPPPMTDTIESVALPPMDAAPIATLPSSAPPAGYDPAKARTLAKQVAANITNKKNNYAREMLAQFQRAAGIASEGIYGGESRGALEFYGVRRPPPALFKPTGTIPYKWASLGSV